MPEQYLMHYGVKGMKWGVRHDTPRSHIFRRSIQGRSVVDKWNGGSARSKKKSDKSRAVRNALLGIAGVSAAAVIGLKVYKYGKMSADTVLKPGTVAQSVAVAEKADFGKSFYAATGRDDRLKILKSFSKQTADRAKKAGLSGKVKANIFTNDDYVKIAGRKEMRKAYKSVYGTNKGFNKFSYSFGAKDEAHRQPFLQELKRRGYGGFKDQDGMRKWWGGETPVVLNGDQSGFRLRNSSTINVDRVGSLPVKDVGTKLQKTEEFGSKVVKATLVGAIGTQAYSSLSKKVNSNKSNRRKS